MAVRKTVVIRQEDGAVFIADTIEYQRTWWIVPEWLEGPTKNTLRPARIISLDGLRLGTPGPQYQVDWALETPLSRDILEGRKVSQSPLVIDRPDIILNKDHDFHR